MSATTTLPAPAEAPRSPASFRPGELILMIHANMVMEGCILQVVPNEHSEGYSYHCRTAHGIPVWVSQVFTDKVTALRANIRELEADLESAKLQLRYAGKKGLGL